MDKKDLIWIVSLVILFSLLIALDKSFRENVWQYQQQINAAERANN